MDRKSNWHTKVRREVFIASIRSAAFYPAGIVVVEVLLASATGLTDLVVALIVATVVATAAYFLALILWARRRAHRIENFVEKLEPRLREAAVTKHEGLVLVLDNGLLLRVEVVWAAVRTPGDLHSRRFLDVVPGDVLPLRRVAPRRSLFRSLLDAELVVFRVLHDDPVLPRFLPDTLVSRAESRQALDFCVDSLLPIGHRDLASARDVDIQIDRKSVV